MQRPKCRKELDLEGMEQQAANVVLGAPGQGDRRWCLSGEEGWHKQGLSAKTRASFLSLYSTFFLLVPAKHKAFCFGQCPAPSPERLRRHAVLSFGHLLQSRTHSQPLGVLLGDSVSHEHGFCK